jgi:hypothetical protein
MDFALIDCDSHVANNPPVANPGACGEAFDEVDDPCTQGFNVNNFSAVGSAVTSDGAQAVASVGGSLTYELGTCTNDICDISITSLGTPSKTLSGSVYEPTGGSYTFEFQNAESHNATSLVGLWYKKTGRVVFPTSGVYINLFVSDVLIAGVSSGFSGSTLIEISQVDGTLDQTNPLLNLNATVTSGDATISITLESFASGTEICGCVSNTCDQNCANNDCDDSTSCIDVCS